MNSPSAGPPPPHSLRRQQPFACEPGKSFRQSHHEGDHMPSTYHLRRTPSEPDFGLNTPPTSPGRRFDSERSRLYEDDMAGLTCACGHSMYDGRGCCPACYDRQKQKSLRSSGAPRRSMTPPPSHPASPEESIDRGRALLVYAKPREGSLDAVFSVASPPQSDHAGGSASTFYDSLPRTASPRSSVSMSSPVRTTTIKHSDDHIGPVIHELAGTVAPASSGGSVDREYSPMAAGFARLGHKEAPPHSHHGQRLDRRREGESSSLDLHARMFDGPA